MDKRSVEVGGWYCLVDGTPLVPDKWRTRCPSTPDHRKCGRVDAMGRIIPKDQWTTDEVLESFQDFADNISKLSPGLDMAAKHIQDLFEAFTEATELMGIWNNEPGR